MRSWDIDAYNRDIAYCVVCGGECLRDERRIIRETGAWGKVDAYICDCCYTHARREEVRLLRVEE